MKGGVYAERIRYSAAWKAETAGADELEHKNPTISLHRRKPPDGILDELQSPKHISQDEPDSTLYSLFFFKVWVLNFQ